MQVAEPRFPLQQAPTCLECGGAGMLVPAARRSNPIGNGGRPYYICSVSRHKERTFITFDDYVGIVPGNPRCDCGFVSRLSHRRDGDGQFYCCPVGVCRWKMNGPLVSLSAVPKTEGFGVGLSAIQNMLNRAENDYDDPMDLD